MSEALISIDGATKQYGEQTVLDAFSLQVNAGEFISLIGPSGCGKTTLLRLLAGLTELSGGAITIDGKAPQTGRQDLAYIFQDPTLLPWRNARRNVELPLELKGETEEKRRETADSLLKLVGLEDAAEKYPRQLSGGMRMRASLARGLSLNPKLLLLDEPFGALDAMTRNRLNAELLLLRERKPFTAFFVTHSVSEAVFLSSKVVIMSPHHGRISAVEQVEFPFPRQNSLRETLEFQRVSAKLTKLLHSAELEGSKCD
ncbi:ABC transporter ATP-binding protein [Rubellicoccus peritrichatus]|uniref:ABC transporter ATP-binding protein n=1 Tax=Rubellicoccus peritrichatus TaxID=3080537 RepID=A0AAQ3LDL9_9BACT|nr:ABC transporter ATP-binding protein [Puniceicoccus sp. CR14]WOO41950.1 ABC transporter ATP-binding protein [Puniceicoccus sp. CR14]